VGETHDRIGGMEVTRSKGNTWILRSYRI